MRNRIFSLSTIALFAPVLAFAQTTTPQTVEVYGQSVAYTEVVAADTDGNGKTDRTTYYDGEAMVLTAYDQNEDGKNDLWLRWENDQVVAELTDTNADGVADKQDDITAEERVVGTPVPALGTDAPATAGESAKGGPMSWVIVIAVAAIAVFLFVRARRRQ
ncbi:MAG: hypothetical protein G01um101431_1057 [Parcubacteria group bacterium Gr01-1014_31]|nr:MAG: hypothetical protein G01um101431_1057 [Parcubacteria group bacterium Gr01-1014_31]